MNAPPLPVSVRLATLAVVTLGALVSSTAASDAWIAYQVQAIEQPDADAVARRFAATPELEQVLKESYAAFAHAQLAAIESMQWSRVAILLLLFLTSSVLFTSALRLRWNVGGPRVAMTRLLGAGALGSAVLRTLDGAQQLAITSRAFGAMAKVLEQNPLPGPQLPPELYRTTGQAGSIALTVFVVAGFLLAGGYFRSARVQQLFATRDSQQPDDEV